MKKALFILALAVFAPTFAQSRACNYNETQLGCMTTQLEHCYPKSDCTTILRCSCASASNPRLSAEDFLETEVTVSCGSYNRKTGTRTCCTYKNGALVGCS